MKIKRIYNVYISEKKGLKETIFYRVHNVAASEVSRLIIKELDVLVERNANNELDVSLGRFSLFYIEKKKKKKIGEILP